MRSNFLSAMSNLCGNPGISLFKAATERPLPSPAERFNTPIAGCGGRTPTPAVNQLTHDDRSCLRAQTKTLSDECGLLGAHSGTPRTTITSGIVVSLSLDSISLDSVD